MRRLWTGAWAVPVVLVTLAGCGITTAGPPAGAGRAANANLTLRTVPTIRSVTVTVMRGMATFTNCTGGAARYNTPSHGDELGYPNGRCWIGSQGGAIFPITITNNGIASHVDVSGTASVPSDGGQGWNLCNIGSHPTVVCSDASNTLPGIDQYLVQNFGPYGKNTAGITDIPQCDIEFVQGGHCWVHEGTAQIEGIELTGPQQASDSSTKWTITITWTPVP
jgi:hypothetical protein